MTNQLHEICDIRADFTNEATSLRTVPHQGLLSHLFCAVKRSANQLLIERQKSGTNERLSHQKVIETFHQPTFRVAPSADRHPKWVKLSSQTCERSYWTG